MAKVRVKVTLGQGDRFFLVTRFSRVLRMTLQQRISADILKGSLKTTLISFATAEKNEERATECIQHGSIRFNSKFISYHLLHTSANHASPFGAGRIEEALENRILTSSLFTLIDMLRSSLFCCMIASDREDGGTGGITIGERDSELDRTSLCVSAVSSAIGLYTTNMYHQYLIRR